MGSPLANWAIPQRSIVAKVRGLMARWLSSLATWPELTNTSILKSEAIQIKKTLIHKAKLKKQRAKELFRAGYASTGPSCKTDSPENRASGQDEKEEENGPDDSMDVDNPRLGSSKLGPRSDGMRIDETISDQYSCSVKRTRGHLHSKESTEPNSPISGPSPKKRKLQDGHPSASSSTANPLPVAKASNAPGGSKDRRSQKARIHHPNGQPRLSHKLSRMLQKIQRDPWRVLAIVFRYHSVSQSLSTCRVIWILS